MGIKLDPDSHESMAGQLEQVGVTISKAKPGTTHISIEHVISEVPPRELLSLERGATLLEAPDDASDEVFVTVTFKMNYSDILLPKPARAGDTP